MANGRDTRQIKRIRNEILVALKVLYPAALQAAQLMRSLLVLFPALEFDQLRRDLHYLTDKGYIGRVAADSEGDAGLTPWQFVQALRFEMSSVTLGRLPDAAEILNV